MQLYRFEEKTARVVFGPELVMLRSDKQFTQLSLSGGKPKRPNVIKSDEQFTQLSLSGGKPKRPNSSTAGTRFLHRHHHYRDS